MIIIFLLILQFSPNFSIIKENIYNITLGNPLNITNISGFEKFIFHLEVKYPQELGIKITIPNEIEPERLEYKTLFVEEGTNPDGTTTYPINKNSIKFYKDKKVRFLIKHFIKFHKTKKCRFYFYPWHKLSYFNIIVDLVKPFYLKKGISQKFTNLLEYYNYQFYLLGVKRFQKINVTIKAKSSEFRPFNCVYVAEYPNKSPDYYFNYNTRTAPFYYDIESDIYNKIYTINFIYDMKLSNIVSLLLSFIYDLDYLDIYFESTGGEIIFNDNNIKNITNIKENLPYYFSTKTNLYQTSLITLRIKSNKNKNNPIVYLNICEFNDKNASKIRKINKQIPAKHINYNEQDELNISFSYQVRSSDITGIALELIPKINLDYIIAKIENMGGTFFINDGDNKTFYNIYPESEFYFWVNASQFQKINININIKSNKENPINIIDIYEYYSPMINGEIYRHISEMIIPERKNNNESFISLYYLVNQLSTKYVLFKIKNKEYIEYLELKLSNRGIVYYLKNEIPMNVTNIKTGNLLYFFIEAGKYNEIFIEFIFKKEYNEHFKYITINEYENKNIVTYIESTKQSFEIKLKENESNINFSYKPSNSLTKYIALILEVNCDIDYLKTKVVVGGGYYEFNKYLKINKMVEKTAYYFPIKISMFQKIEMKIILEDNVLINNSFTFANIYEKHWKDDIGYNKYHKQTFVTEKNSGYLEQYFTYSIENFTTNYILIELIPEYNIKNILIKYKIENCHYNLYNGKSNNINKIKEHTPYYFYISSKKFQQVNINLTVDYKQNIPFEYVEIYELINKNIINSAKKYLNKTINFININNNNLESTFNYITQSVFTNHIIIKIVPKYFLNFLNIKMDVGGDFYELEKNSTKNITNLFSDYSYYCFVLCSKGEKFNFKLTLNSSEIMNPFNALNVYEYTNKNNPSIYLQKTAEKFNTEIKGNQTISFISYKAKNKDTNYIALEIIPNYNISYVECLIESIKEEDNASSFSIVKILTIILIVVIFITTLLFCIYIKRKFVKSSSDSLEILYQKNNDKKFNEKKFELDLL